MFLADAVQTKGVGSALCPAAYSSRGGQVRAPLVGGHAVQVLTLHVLGQDLDQDRVLEPELDHPVDAFAIQGLRGPALARGQTLDLGLAQRRGDGQMGAGLAARGFVLRLPAASLNPASMRSRPSRMHHPCPATSQKPPDSFSRPDVIQGWRRRFAMPSTVQLRDDYDAAQLRLLAKRSRDPRQIRRLLALAAVYDGMSRAEAARVGGMDRQMLRDWAHRFNEDGPEGLTDRRRAGRPRQLTDAQMEELAEIVETGPDPATDGVVRWRRVDLKRVIEERFGVVYSERTISDLLARLSFSYISGRPQHPRQDQQVLEAFKKTSPARWRPT